MPEATQLIRGRAGTWACAVGSVMSLAPSSPHPPDSRCQIPGSPVVPHTLGPYVLLPSMERRARVSPAERADPGTHY